MTHMTEYSDDAFLRRAAAAQLNTAGLQKDCQANGGICHGLLDAILSFRGLSYWPEERKLKHSQSKNGLLGSCTKG